MRQWPNDATVAHLIFVDHQVVPTTDTIEAAIEHARRRGARSIRTSALFPASAEIMEAAGFRQIDQLALLRLALDHERVAHLGAARHRVRTMHPWMHGRAAAVDQAAFGLMWGNDAAGIRDVRRATPVHHARLIKTGRNLAGFALSGAAADSGYLQRIAVAPDQRRRGIASDLVVDAVRWMYGQGRSRCLVNTGQGNHAALALYERLGFDRMADVLTIAELRLNV